ncbi:VPLPA-CTERM sorting domain-containing protein [Jannaschia seohaensis]|uniref:Putative secreted protein n=1 Tax=Jannaschia seohaensis TaxID=475081 RepID=A0A2Y9AP43_9RHOB|nr:VPLPA-CTERM sorting domain-containing protein [Jannaschia seohaensis]PWJ19194.1 putative secreted protein [Jannaschia seohaensis]SSA45856.1 VPLPA-CTERM protein sorting domain-containing protein [Jannaschia seohaensis]
MLLRFAAIVAFVAGSVGAQAATLSLSPTADGSMRVNINGTAINETDPTVTTLRSGATNDGRGFFIFDLSGIAAGSTIGAATFGATFTGTPTNTVSDFALRLDAFGGDGIIDTSDYAATASRFYDVTRPRTEVTAGDRLEVSASLLSQAVQGALTTGFLTVRSSTANFATINFASSENTTYNAPSLSIEFTPPAEVPLPAGGVLLLGALGAAVLLRRRRG